MKKLALALVALALIWPAAFAAKKTTTSAIIEDTPARPRSSSKTTLSVSEISCEGCVTALEQQLQRIVGVTAYDVDQARGKAEVSYDPDTTDAGAIAESLLQSGFQVVLAPWEPVDASFNGCSNGSCGTRIPNAPVSAQPGATPGQKVYCPVSGVVLLVRASTPTVKVDGKPIRVCCDGCARYFKANRDRVLALRGLPRAS